MKPLRSNAIKESSFLRKSSRDARKHGAKAAKRGISSEYVAICTGIQRDGKTVAETVNRAKLSGKELYGIFGTHIAEDTLILTDGLRGPENSLFFPAYNSSFQSNTIIQLSIPINF